MDMLVTGVSGSGKTTIANALIKHGYTAYNMDSVAGLCAWVDLATGKPKPNFKITSASDWVDRYDWHWNDKRLRQLLGKPGQNFFCGSSGNQEKFYSLFYKIFLLEMNKQLIEERVLNSNREHDYGKKPGELAAIFSYYKKFQDNARVAGAVVIDASMSTSQTIKTILAEVG